MSGGSARIAFLWAVLLMLGLRGSGVEAGKMHLTQQARFVPRPVLTPERYPLLTRYKYSRLAILFSDASFAGNYFTVEGIYSSCYNIRNQGKGGSIMLEKRTEYCEVWGVDDCGDWGGLFPQLLFFVIPRYIEWEGWIGLGICMKHPADTKQGNTNPSRSTATQRSYPWMAWKEMRKMR
jgi:hypothetical protein